MATQALEVRNTFPASFVLPLSDELRSIDGWLELDAERVAFRSGQGLELRMRLDRVAEVSLPSEEEHSERSIEPTENGDLADDAAGDPLDPVGLMRLAGDCGPAAVAWDLLINRDDAHSLGEELSAALGDPSLVTEDVDSGMDVIPLERDSGPSDDVLPQIDGHRRARLRNWWHRRREAQAQSWQATDHDRRALLIRRRRIMALMIATAVLIVAIEIAVTVFLVPG